MRTRLLLATALLCIASIGIVSQVLAADTLMAGDFSLESFSKVVDYFDYARAYATIHGLPPAYVTYVAIPEFPSNAILPLMIVSALLIVLYIKRKELSGTRQRAKT